MEPTASSADREDRVLVAAASPRDADLTLASLARAHITAELCDSAEALAGEIEAGAGAALMAEEILTESALWRLSAVLDRQPPWSDFPIVIVTHVGVDGSSHSPVALSELGNVMLLERPFRRSTLVGVVRAALRSRRRQYQFREELLERQRLAAAAEAANQAKDEFLAVLSHELRTPLTSMLGWVRMLQSGQLDAAGAAHGLNVVERNVQQQTQLINDLLDISRIMSGKLTLDRRPLDLVPVVAVAVEMVRPLAAAKGVTLELQQDREIEMIDGDPGRLQQVAWNLVSNAVKFTPAGGDVRVALERDADRARIIVTDTGVGIAAEFLPQLFERFRQADSSIARAHGGLGLGLAIVRHLVEQHGGRVTAASDGPGLGATFTVELPVLVPSAAATSGMFEPALGGDRAQGPALDGVRVLLLDDDLDTLDLLQTILRQYGATVTAVSSTAAALATLERDAPDVIVSDIAMPGEDGYALIAKIRAAAEAVASTPALALTAHARSEDRGRALRAGFQMHLAKPVEPAVLARAVDMLRRSARKLTGS